MKVAFVALLFGLALAGPSLSLDSSEEVVPQEAIDWINSSQDQWTASKDWIADMTIEDASKFATTEIRPREFPEHNWGALIDYVAVPDSFDSRTKWPNCIHPVLDQGQCGSCWAFGATEALSDRLCITNSADVVLAPQYLVDCDTNSYGCQGGYPDLAWHFMKDHGVPTMECVPYTAKDGRCPSTCSDGSSPKLYHAPSVSTYSGPTSIQNAIMSGGPVETAFTVYQDFMSYNGGIYKHTWGGVLGGHAVKIVGWGTQGSTKYWIIQNSWGTSWGLQGFFWIEFGQCGIDSQAVASS